MAKVEHVVVDSCAFIKNAPIKDIGENVYTLADVVGEIRDKVTREALQVLPYELKFKEPSTEAIKHVTEFSKKTGDYKSLSAVDIRLMALVYQLEKENVGTEHLRETPKKETTWGTTKQQLEKPTAIVGFYFKKKNCGTSRSASRTTSETEHGPDPISETDKLDKNLDNLNLSNENPQVNSDTGEQETSQETATVHVETQQEENSSTGTESSVEKAEVKESEENKDSDSVDKNSQFTEGDTILMSDIEEVDSDDDDDEEEEDEDDDDDDDEGWITPSNIKEVKKAIGGDAVKEKADVPVACITMDFAMQNVLLQMGLNVVSVDGYILRHARSFALRCFACMKITTNMMKEFCPHCGNKTLHKVSMTVKEDGTIQYYVSRRRPISTRGMKYTLPKPKGGKHANNPILCEDQKGAQQLTSKMGQVKYNPLDPDYIAMNSPFAPKDIYSRAAQLGVRNQRNDNFRSRRNPNENSRTGRRK